MALTISPDITEEVLAGPLFSGLAPAAVEAFLEGLPRWGFNHGDALFREGEPAGSMYVAVDGSVLVARLTSAGENVKLAQLETGSVLGELSVLGSAVRSATAIGLGRGGVVEISRATFEAELALGNPVAVTLLQNLSLQLCGRIRATDDKVARLHAALHGAAPEAQGEALRRLVAGGDVSLERLGREVVAWLRKRQ